MKTDAIKTYWKENKLYEYPMINGSKIRIKIEKNSYKIPLDHLITMASRNNPNRSFLFVSKILGKHLPMNPKTGLMGNHIMAAKLMEDVYSIKDEYRIKELVSQFMGEDGSKGTFLELNPYRYKLPEPVIFIGFAETATGLAQGIFNSFEGEAYYTHTTREVLSNIDSNITFKEEHSHAKNHICYGIREDVFNSKRPIILIDDELTTGKTILNIIEALQGKYPREKYIVLSILDWRNQEDRNRFKEIEKKLGISIQVVSLISGEIQLIEGIPTEPIKFEEEVAISQEETKVNIEYLRLDDYFKEPFQYLYIDRAGKERPGSYLKETGRFGLYLKEQQGLNHTAMKIGQFLSTKIVGGNTLCLGTEEFIYIPMLIAAYMGQNVRYHSTTRSPIYPLNKEGYGIQNKFSFESPSGNGVINYVYNIPYKHYDQLFLFLEREVEPQILEPLLTVLKQLGIPNIFILFCSGVDPKPFTGSYKKEDVVFLLKDISNALIETDTEDKEEAIQSGVHYSEMLPIEYKPSKEYIDLFYQSLEDSARRVALAIGVVSEKILARKGPEVVLVSLARAGTPMGILIKRYLGKKYKLQLPHYSVSIIRGKGLDVNAIQYILKRHPGRKIQFIDGWTGKGVITQVLAESCEQLNHDLGVVIDPDLAVLADPAHCTNIFGTREDFLIPSACLNATVSGLISRTVHRQDLIGPHDFHGAKYYDEMQDQDRSNMFIDRITSEFSFIEGDLERELKVHESLSDTVTWKGLEDIKTIQNTFNIGDINLIKPGIGETTRVLLRRIPWKILVRDKNSDDLKHILLLAREKGVPIREYPHMAYQCCGLIKPLSDC